MRRRGFDIGIWLVVCALAIVAVIVPGTVKNRLFHKQAETTMSSAMDNVNPTSADDEPVTEPVSVTENKTGEPVSTTVSDKPYLIKINRKQNVVTVYSKDTSGAYTVPVKAFVCSAGRGTNTPLGTFHTSAKYTWKILIGEVWGQYSTRIVGGVLFHSVPYTSKEKNTLEYWEYNRLGTNRSLGCIRLTVIDAKWIFDNCPLGTTVVIYESSDPGPLGKPTALKIDTSLSFRGWDPTDPDPDNPWKNYTPTTEPVATLPATTTTTKPTTETPTKPTTETTSPSTSDTTEPSSTEPDISEPDTGGDGSPDTTGEN